MSTYFPCNIPLDPPKYVHPELAAKWRPLAKRLHDRFDKFNEAIDIVGCRGEDFSVAARKALTDKSGESFLPCHAGGFLMDAISAQELADVVAALRPLQVSAPERLDWPNAVPIADAAFLTTEEWEIIRTLSIGGSDAAVALGISPYRSTYELYHDKIGTPPKKKGDAGKAFIFEYGHRIEALVINEFCRRTGAYIIPETRMFRHATRPFLSANIDGIINLEGKLFIFECKTTTEFNKDAWSGGKIPPQYIPQLNQYMAVLNDERVHGAFIACVYGNTPDCFVSHRVERDIAAEADQIEELTYFWENHVLKNVEPDLPADAEEAFLTYGVVPPNGSDQHILLDEENADVIEEYLDLQEKRKVLEKQAEELKEQEKVFATSLNLVLDGAPVGYYDLGDGTMYEVKQKTTTRKNVNMDALETKYPDVFNDVVTTNVTLNLPTIKRKKKPKKLDLTVAPAAATAPLT